MKKPLCVLISDSHLTKDNYAFVEEMFEKVIKKCKEIDVEQVFHLGDWFTNRTGQPLETLMSTQRIFQRFDDNNIVLNVIPGNHDKKDLTSNESYLSIFKDSFTLKIYSKPDSCDLSNDVKLHLLPYYKEGDVYIYNLNQLSCGSKKNVLLTHIGINGALNNDKTEVKSEVEVLDFECFDKVFVGHYHDRREIGENIIYTGSLYPSNYGEDNEKGGVILYDDLSYDFFGLDFPLFIRVEMKAEKLEPKDLDYLKTLKDGGNSIRVVVKDSKSKLKVFDKNILNEIGVECKLEEESVERESLNDTAFQLHSINSILEYFKSFCEERKLSFEEGFEFFKKK